MHDLGSAQQLPARPQTVTPGSIRGPTRKTVIAFREFPIHPPSQGAALPKTPPLTTPRPHTPKLRIKGF